eukprot:TRINITY_DN3955_c0_g1_i1.p1 TRINITY_DN3955_c0_g1~~TRINITY_DN3955_c0_g1_i1.p1  ORF type:complete len:633 (+),score=274.51 TRINITY_DN3955_c0_g1_i1:1891-3789(+)
MAEHLQHMIRETEQRLAETQQKANKLRSQNEATRDKLEAERKQLDARRQDQIIREHKVRQRESELKAKEQLVHKRQLQVNTRFHEIEITATELIRQRGLVISSKQSTIEQLRNITRQQVEREAAKQISSLTKELDTRPPLSDGPAFSKAALGHPFMKLVRDYSECRTRVGRIHLPPTFKQMDVHWPKWEAGSVKVGEDTVTIEGEYDGQYTADAAGKHVAKVIILSLQGKKDEHLHHRLSVLSALVNNELTCYGGPWEEDIDGGNPEDEATLVKVINRHFRDMTNTSIPQEAVFKRFVDIQSVIDNELHTESYFLCDLSDCEAISVQDIIETEMKEVTKDVEVEVEEPVEEEEAKDKEEPKEEGAKEEKEAETEEKEEQAKGEEEDKREGEGETAEEEKANEESKEEGDKEDKKEEEKEEMEVDEKPKTRKVKKMVQQTETVEEKHHLVKAKLIPFLCLVTNMHDPSMPVVSPSFMLMAHCLEELMNQRYGEKVYKYLSENLARTSKRKREDDEDEVTRVRSQGREPALVKKTKVVTETTDTSVVNAFGYFDRPAHRGDRRRGILRHGRVRDMLASLDQPDASFRKIDKMLTSIGLYPEMHVVYADKLVERNAETTTDVPSTEDHDALLFPR